MDYEYTDTDSVVIKRLEREIGEERRKASVSRIEQQKQIAELQKQNEDQQAQINILRETNKLLDEMVSTAEIETDNWKNITDEKPTKETRYLTKRTQHDSPSVTLFMPGYDGFGKNSGVTLWCEIPE